MPFYGVAVYCRNLLYRLQILRAKETPVPSIGIGNLCAGGTGKTPMVEYLIRLLHENHRVATLSLGYGRKTSGFLIAEKQHTSSDIGDEPLQYYTKFPDVVVSVGKNRFDAINKLKASKPDIEIVLLDDVFQHRQVQPGFSILLTDFYHPFFEDYLLPAGNLREHRNNHKRADIIVVTKSPKILSPITKETFVEKIKPLPHQQVVFSYIKHGILTQPNGKPCEIVSQQKIYFLLLVGIVNYYPLEEYLKRITDDVEVFAFPDHHDFTEKDLLKIKAHFFNYFSNHKYLVTTEKDYMRMKDSPAFEIIKDLPICYVPMEIEFFAEDKKIFDQTIKHYVEKSC